MARIYEKKIRHHDMTLEQVPPYWRETVRRLLEEEP